MHNIYAFNSHLCYPSSGLLMCGCCGSDQQQQKQPKENSP